MHTHLFHNLRLGAVRIRLHRRDDGQVVVLHEQREPEKPAGRQDEGNEQGG